VARDWSLSCSGDALAVFADASTFRSRGRKVGGGAMTVSRWSKRALLLTLLAVIGFLGYWFWLWPDPVTWQNYRKIEEGMTESEVRSLLGRETSKGSGSSYSWYPKSILKDTMHMSYWRGHKFVIRVFYDRQLRVTGKMCVERIPDD
jgi:hypothetical protein